MTDFYSQETSISMLLFTAAFSTSRNRIQTRRSRSFIVMGRHTSFLMSQITTDRVHSIMREGEYIGFVFFVAVEPVFLRLK